MGYPIPDVSNDTTVGSALLVAKEGCMEINAILSDIQTDNVLGDKIDKSATSTDPNNLITNDGEARWVLSNYGIEGNANITQASGAMVIDDLMQKISTKVQVAAQLLSTANNINKTASRIMSQG